MDFSIFFVELHAIENKEKLAIKRTGNFIHQFLKVLNKLYYKKYYCLDLYTLT